MVRRLLATAVLVAGCRTGQGEPGHAPSRAHREEGPLVTLDVDVRGRGTARVVGLGVDESCAGACRYEVVRGTKVMLAAVSREDFFDGWTDPCGSDPDCTLTAVRDVAVGVRFGADRYRFAWARAFSATDCIGVDSLTARDGLVLTGLVRGAATIDSYQVKSAGHNDVLVAGFDRSSGQARFARLMGDAGNDGHKFVDLAPDGNLVIQLWNYVSQPSMRWIDARSGTVERAYTTSTGMHHLRLQSDQDIVGVILPPQLLSGPSTVTRLDTKGNARWSTSLAATGRVFVRTTIVDWPELLVIGQVQGEPLFARDAWDGSRDAARDASFLARLDLETGAVTGARWLFSAKRLEKVEDAVIDEDGNLVFALVADSTSFLGQPLTPPESGRWVWIVSASGGLERINWIQRFGSAAWVSDVRLWTHSGGLVVSGFATGSIEIGSRTVGGGTDSSDGTSFVAVLAPDGVVRWAGGADTGRGYRAPAVASDAAGNVYLAGGFSREMRLGDHALAPKAGGACGSIYLAKLVSARARRR